jgi:hypothetical protein
MLGRSCTTNLLIFLEQATVANNSRGFEYLDFSKAFDKVPHRRLLRKMEAKKIRLISTIVYSQSNIAN